MKKKDSLLLKVYILLKTQEFFEEDLKHLKHFKFKNQPHTLKSNVRVMFSFFNRFHLTPNLRARPTWLRCMPQHLRLSKLSRISPWKKTKTTCQKFSTSSSNSASHRWLKKRRQKIWDFAKSSVFLEKLAWRALQTSTLLHPELNLFWWVFCSQAGSWSKHVLNFRA